MRIFSLLFFIQLPFFIQAQFLHMPDEIQSIMDQSAIQYTSTTLSETVSPFEIYPPAALNKEVSRLPIHPPLVVRTQEDIEKSRLKAKKMQDAGKFKQAITHYQKILAQNTDQQALTQIAFCYHQLEDYTKSIQWYEKLKLDYPAHPKVSFLLAQVYYEAQKYEEALREVTIAHLLQPQDDAIFQKMTKFYEHLQLLFPEWTLSPQFRLQAETPQRIRIAYRGVPWLAYANCKSLWKYEPNYAKDMVKIANVPASIVEEKECLLNALIAYEGLPEEEKVNYPEMASLAVALQQKIVNSYILYEIKLKNGQIQWQNIAEPQQEGILHYLKTIRSQAL